MNLHLGNQQTKSRIAGFVLVGMIASYTTMIGTWSVNRFMSFNATLWDMGLMAQAIWNTAHGRILHETINLGYSASRLAVAHWEFIYLPLAVIYRFIPSIPLLLYIQALILACGTIPIYRFAANKLSSRTAGILIALAYLFYPALHGANLFDLHGLTLATTFLLFTFYYLDQGKQIQTLIFALLSLACREDVALIVLSLGLFAWFRKKERQIAIPLLLLGIAWLAIFFLRFQFIGSTELAEKTSMVPNWEHLALKNFFRSPIRTILTVAQHLLSPVNIQYLLKLVLPILGLCFLSLDVLMIAAPTLLLNLMSQWPQMHQIEYHYTATITPFVFLAAINGLARLRSQLHRIIPRTAHRMPIVLSAMIALAAILSTTQFSILRFHKSWQVTNNHRKLSQRLYALPSELSVSATARVGAHLTNRCDLYHFPERFSEADIIVLELNRPEIEIKNFTGRFRTRKIAPMNEWTRAVLQDSTLKMLWVEDNVFCLQRESGHLSHEDQFFTLDTLPDDAVIINNLAFNDGLNLIGWQPVYIGKQQAHYALYWKKNKPISCPARLNFYFSAGDSLHIIDHQPIFGRVPIQNWPTDKMIVDHLFIDRLDNEAAITYSVVASISHNDDPQLQHLFNFNFQ